MEFFERGYVCWTNIPESNHTYDTPKPGFFLHGRHMCIVLHDHDLPDIRNDLALVVPITSAKAEVKKALKENRSILPSYVPIVKTEYGFLEEDSYVSTAQIMPVNRNWMDQYIDKVEPEFMELVDLQIIQNIGLMSMVAKMAQSLYQDKLVEVEAAVTKEALLDQ
ncbi:type II toxin-antitoxin system PemK/MazF family toxin [Bacillus sp. FSL K6-6540]|uniref:type II toxin-antitoxin system PemK/MazF family toxin n=1 Tax=Bacillus sp. FSL K6-6540 TaxID=2921512 RepID=UPI0030FA0D7F